jgi:hypothetical protein
MIYDVLKYRVKNVRERFGRILLTKFQSGNLLIHGIGPYVYEHEQK